MAGQPEEYQDATRLDAKEDTARVVRYDSFADSNAIVDTFEILTDTPGDSTEAESGDQTGPR